MVSGIHWGLGTNPPWIKRGYGRTTLMQDVNSRGSYVGDGEGLYEKFFFFYFLLDFSISLKLTLKINAIHKQTKIIKSGKCPISGARASGRFSKPQLAAN